jgi:hypothetical protein
MWAYYCDNSKGFCFELEWSDAVLGRYQIEPVGVLYSSVARVHNRADIFDTLIREEAELHPNWSVERILEETRSEFFMFRFTQLRSLVVAGSGLLVRLVLAGDSLLHCAGIPPRQAGHFLPGRRK